MSRISTVGVRSRYIPTMVMITVSLAVLGGMALAAQDRLTLKVPNGPAFSDFRGYENWRNVAVSQTEHGLKVIAANTAMTDAYRSGIPGNGKHFPDGSKIVKIEWSPKKNPGVPLFRDGAGYFDIGFVHREGHQEIPGTRADGDTLNFNMMRRPTRLLPSGATPHAVMHATRL